MTTFNDPDKETSWKKKKKKKWEKEKNADNQYSLLF